MEKHISMLCSAAFVAALCGTASAYTLTGTVKDGEGNAVKDAKVSLTNLNQSAITDVSGAFTIHEDEDIQAIRNAQKPGNFSLNNGILSFSQGASTPVQVKVFDMMGNQVFNKTLQGNGSIDLSSAVKAQGNYLARVKLGSTQQTIRFNATGNYSGSFGMASTSALLKEVAPGGEPLQVTADGFDTLHVNLTNLDTVVELKLNKAASANIGEETFAFGYALKNAPRKSKGCGKDPVLEGNVSYNCEAKSGFDWNWQNPSADCRAQKFSINVEGAMKPREFYVTFPENYDKNKPYKLLFANHCMGSSAQNMATWIAADRDHISPYYAQKAQDKEGNYIFVAPQGDVSGMWVEGANDHRFFDALLTHLEDNYCIDTTRVFATGFSFGAMFTNSLAQDMQHRLRAVAVYATAAYNIWLPQENGTNKDLPIAWMAVHGKTDQRCQYADSSHCQNRGPGARDSALVHILRLNKAEGKDAVAEKDEKLVPEHENIVGHKCYDFQNVDPRFPVKFCSHNADHLWSATDDGDHNNSWVPGEVHKFFEQF